MTSLDISAIIITIAPVGVYVGNMWAIETWKHKKRLQSEIPMATPDKTDAILDQSIKKKSLVRKNWLVLFVGFMAFIYVLSEILQPGELTRLAVYKIVTKISHNE
jgi:hypothetical protein